MNRNIVLALVAGFVAGGIVGYLLGSSSSRENAGVVTAAPAATGTLPGTPVMPPGMGTPGAVPNPDLLRLIPRLEAAVLSDPKNHTAWVDLGNAYFDTQQPQKAITAYGKALALKPADPNVLTDQGVMYRQLSQFDKALANFQKASKLDPTHIQSLFNTGIVYSEDLHKPEEAAKAWNRVISVAPTSEQANQARQMLSQEKARLKP